MLHSLPFEWGLIYIWTNIQEKYITISYIHIDITIMPIYYIVFHYSVSMKATPSSVIKNRLRAHCGSHYASLGYAFGATLYLT
jgi:hypothetical protein